MITYRTKSGDMLDDICFRHYGQSMGTIEQVLIANPGLASAGPVFVAGIEIGLPAITPASVAEPVRIWD